MKRIIKSKIFIFIIGIILGSVGIVSAYSLISKDVGFTPKDTSWEVDNVKSALDDLYERITNNNIVYLTTLGSTGNTIVTQNYTFTKNYKYVIVSGNGTNNNNNTNATCSSSISSSTATTLMNRNSNKKGDGSHYAGLYMAVYKNVSKNDVLTARIGYGGQFVILGIE